MRSLLIYIDDYKVDVALLYDKKLTRELKAEPKDNLKMPSSSRTPVKVLTRREKDYEKLMKLVKQTLKEEMKELKEKGATTAELKNYAASRLSEQFFWLQILKRYSEEEGLTPVIMRGSTATLMFTVNLNYKGEVIELPVRIPDAEAFAMGFSVSADFRNKKMWVGGTGARIILGIGCDKKSWKADFAFGVIE